jgi:hypothetical protein
MKKFVLMDMMGTADHHANSILQETEINDALKEQLFKVLSENF